MSERRSTRLARLAKRAYQRAYHQRPEVKARVRAYEQRPEVKERARARGRAYYQRPEVKARMRAYYQRPEVRARRRAHAQRPEVKVHRRTYDQRPEVKAHRRAAAKGQTVADRKPVAAEKLRRCLSNPALAGRIAGPHWVVCLARTGEVVCGLLYESLANHLRLYHDMSVRQYRQLYGADVPIQSAARQRAQREQLSRQHSDVRWRLKRMESRRLPDGLVRTLFVRGLTLREMVAELEKPEFKSAELDRASTAIWRQGRSLGLPQAGCLLDLGQLVDGQYARALRDRWGLTTDEFKTNTGMSINSLVGPPGHRRLKPPEAEKLIRWQKRVIAKARSISFREQPRRLYPRNASSVLLTARPYLPEMYGFVLKVLAEVRIVLSGNLDAGVEEVQRFLGEQARSEVLEHSPEKTFRRFLRLPLAVDDLLKRDLPLLRGPGRLKRIACEWLASLCGTERAVVEEALAARTQRLPPDKMRATLEEIGELEGKGSRRQELPADRLAAQPAAEPKPREKRGHACGWVMEETKRRIRFAAALKCFGVNPYRIAQLLDPEQKDPQLLDPEQRDDREKAYELGKKVMQRNARAIQEEMESMDTSRAVEIIRSWSTHHGS